MEQILRIADFILKSFLHIWPYLLVSIPLAVVVNMSGAAKYITKAFGKNPMLSVFFATVVGAFSPFCSCGVIPVISSLLIGGIPLAPVMSFWIASPSMDPEIFFLSSSVIGWKLAIWRLSSTFAISLSAGYITYFANVKGFIGDDVLRTQSQREIRFSLKSFISSIKSLITTRPIVLNVISSDTRAENVCCTVSDFAIPENCECQVKPAAKSCSCEDDNKSVSWWKRLAQESIKATLLVTKFMILAFFITALITFYVPADIISGIISLKPSTQVTLATAIGIPMYTSNITALPMVAGLIELGLNKGAALSFLIAGATTTLPAMVAVWGITKRKVFALYLSFVLLGALISGFLFNFFN